MGNSSSKNEVTFIKRGLRPKEFEESVLRNVEKLLKSYQLFEIETLMTTTVAEVTKDVCLQVNETNPYTLDGRRTSTKSFIQEGILDGVDDPPRRRVERTGGQQRQQRADRAWRDQYHSEQHTLFMLPFMQNKLFSQSPKIILKHEAKGYLFKMSSGKKLTTNEFCYAIDQITSNLGKELSILREDMPNENYSNQWMVTLNAVSSSCRKILMLRLVSDCAIDNDLMDSRNYEIWRDHLMVIITFATLWVVVRMMVARLAKNWGPDPQLNVIGTKASTPVIFLAVAGIPVVVSFLCERALSHR